MKRGNFFLIEDEEEDRRFDSAEEAMKHFFASTGEAQLWFEEGDGRTDVLLIQRNHEEIVSAPHKVITEKYAPEYGVPDEESLTVTELRSACEAARMQLDYFRSAADEAGVGDIFEQVIAQCDAALALKGAV